MFGLTWREWMTPWMKGAFWGLVISVVYVMIVVALIAVDVIYAFAFAIPIIKFYTLWCSYFGLAKCQVIGIGCDCNPAIVVLMFFIIPTLIGAIIGWIVGKVKGRK